MKIRIKFTKYSCMKFIGHLDIMRYFQKAVRRADIHIAYSTGYSPHQIMSFAAPLGVGLMSNGEYLDIEVNTWTSSEDMKQRLQAVMAEGIDIVSIRALPENTGNAMASVAAASYTLTFREGYTPDFNLEKQLTELYAQTEIQVVKQTKKSTKEFDVKPYIFELKTENNAVSMKVDASSSGNIKPTLVMEAIYAKAGRELPEFALEITREETYGNAGSAEIPELIPLEDFGVIF